MLGLTCTVMLAGCAPAPLVLPTLAPPLDTMPPPPFTPPSPSATPSATPTPPPPSPSATVPPPSRTATLTPSPFPPNGTPRPSETPVPSLTPTPPTDIPLAPLVLSLRAAFEALPGVQLREVAVDALPSGGVGISVVARVPSGAATAATADALRDATLALLPPDRVRAFDATLDADAAPPTRFTYDASRRAWTTPTSTPSPTP